VCALWGALVGYTKNTTAVREGLNFGAETEATPGVARASAAILSTAVCWLARGSATAS
jgi:hypothetical protein